MKAATKIQIMKEKGTWKNRPVSIDIRKDEDAKPTCSVEVAPVLDDEAQPKRKRGRPAKAKK